jgi:hypothetical protein
MRLHTNPRHSIGKGGAIDSLVDERSEWTIAKQQPARVRPRLEDQR